MAREASVPKLLTAFPSIVSAIEESSETNIPASMLPDLVSLLGSMDVRSTVLVGFTPPLYVSSWNAEGYPYPNVELIQSAVQKAFNESPEALGQSFDLQPVAQSCGWSE